MAELDSQQLEQWQQAEAAARKIAELRQRISDLFKQDPEAGSPMAKKVERLREELHVQQDLLQVAQQRMQLAQAGPALPIPPSPQEQLQAQLTAQNPAAMQAAMQTALQMQQMREHLQQAGTRGLGMERTGQGVLRAAVHGDITSVAQEGVAGLAGTLGKLPGPLGLAASAAGILGGGIMELERAFRNLRPTVEQMLDLTGTSRSALERQRGTGIATQEDVLRTFSGGTSRRIIEAQNAGDTAGVMRIARDAEANLQQRLQAAVAMRPEQHHREAMALLEGAQQSAQTGGDVGGQREAIRRAVHIHEQTMGIRAPQELRDLTPERLRTMTDAQIRQLNEGILSPVLGARAALETAGNIGRMGFAPRMSPGAPGIENLPNLFQSRQSDVLDVHAQVQQEMVRDQRQALQFERQMALWETIQRDIATMRDNVGQPPPVVG